MRQASLAAYRRRRLAPDTRPPADADWLEGEDKMRLRKAECEARMALIDNLPAPFRQVVNGLPLHEWLLPAIESGCTSQEDAEEWVRLVVGKDVLA